MMSDVHQRSTRRFRSWTGIALRCLAPVVCLLVALVCAFVAHAAAGFSRAVWLAVAVIFLGFTWGLVWRVLRYRTGGRYLAALQSGAPVTITRRPHVAIAATMISMALTAIAVSINLAGELHASIVGLPWLLVISAGAFSFIYWRRCRFPMIVSANGLTDRTARLENIAWSRIFNCRIWAPKGIPLGIFIEIQPERGWDAQCKTIDINCLDLAARPEEVLTMFELRGAQKLRS
ncbi:hypothetical protein [Dongia sedimenti]|uniref:PH (Pleckstrin Homology) domain-containing protein n=1 Tax=Dongia sedimenti TaxID=3064282 RepID=A0ABU0YK25_9PROT|nr:hypothetical protein [Rhodospirillaceae bacterium R-7]